MAGNRQVESTQSLDREIDRLEWLVAAGHDWLRFPRDLEKEFAESVADGLLDYRRRVVVAAFVVLLVAGVLDLLVVKRGIDGALLLRYGVAVPLGALFLAYSRSTWFRATQQPALCLLTFLLAALLFGLMIIGGDRVLYVYLPGVLLLAVFAGMLLRLQFWLSALLLGAMGIAYMVFLVRIRPQPMDILVPYTLFYGAAVLIALFANYHLEHASRRRFLQVRLLALKQGELELANQRLQELADQDGLTGVANRRHFDQHLATEWSRARRSGQSLSLMLIDLDFFKRYNDSYGHQAGDDCLIVVGAVLRSHAQRPGDLAARYGGEEFALILPATDVSDAKEIASRVIHDLAAYRIPHRASEVSDVVTASAGVAGCVPSPLLSSRDLLAAADAALYRAKRDGRNRVEVSLDLPAGDEADATVPATGGSGADGAQG
ncbi:MAG: diguanylate cyclase domain-containing protein [Gammaproteobacteria bacterium]